MCFIIAYYCDATLQMYMLPLIGTGPLGTGPGPLGTGPGPLGTGPGPLGTRLGRDPCGLCQGPYDPLGNQFGQT